MTTNAAVAVDPATTHRPSGDRSLHPVALAAVLAAVMVPIMSFFTVNVALGDIGNDLHASPGLLQLVVAGYGVVYASLVTIGGRLGDGFGRKRLLLIGLATFALTSAVCSLAQTSAELIAGRFVQGIGAALVSPQVLATLHATTSGKYRARAMAWFGASGGLGTSLAFVVGGALSTSDAGWRSIFWINVPVAALIGLIVWRFVPDTKASSRPPLDLVGAVGLAAALTLLVLPVTEGRAIGWPAWTWVCLALFVPATVVLIWWQRRLERRGGTPLVPPSLFRVRSISTGLAVSVPFYLAFAGFMFVFAFAGQASRLTPLGIGLRLLPLALAILVSSIVAARLIERFGIWVLTVGGIVAAVGFWFVGSSGVDASPVLMAVLGIGLGFVWSPLMAVVLGQVPTQLAGLGSGVLITTMQAGLGLGSAVVGSLYLAQGDPVGSGFVHTLAGLGAVMVLLAALTRLLPSGR